MPMMEPGDEGGLTPTPPSPFATRPTTNEPAAEAPQHDDKIVDAVLLRVREEAKRRRAVAPSSPTPGFFSRINWDDIRKKGWHAALIVGSAYISAKPEKYGWLMPVLTAVAGSSAPPTGKPITGVAAVLAVMALTLGWRVWL